MAEHFPFNDVNGNPYRINDFAYRDLSLAWMEGQQRQNHQNVMVQSPTEFGEFSSNEIITASSQLGELVRGGYNATTWWPKRYSSINGTVTGLSPEIPSIPENFRGYNNRPVLGNNISGNGNGIRTPTNSKLESAKDRKSNLSDEYDRSDDSSPLNPESFQAPPQQAIPDSSTSLRGVKRKTAEEREQARAEQQRKASRKYREKKKVLVEQLEDKMKELISEKESLERDHKKALEQIVQLKQEAMMQIKKPQSVNPPSPTEEMNLYEKERLAVLKKLDTLYQSGASDALLMETIMEAENICKKIVGVAECHYKFLISPSFVSFLTKTGFFGKDVEINRAEPTNPQESPDSIRVFVSRIKEILSTDLSQDQLEKMNVLADKYFVDLEIVKAEKQHINSDIVQYFDSTNNKESHNQEVSKLLQVVSTLEILRRTLQDESRVALTTMNTIVCLLNPRQRAKFHLQVEYTHRAVDQLKKLWDAMKTGNATKFV